LDGNIAPEVTDHRELSSRSPSFLSVVKRAVQSGQVKGEGQNGKQDGEEVTKKEQMFPGRCLDKVK